MNIITILYCLLLSAATVGAEQVSVSDYISQCVDEHSDFTVKLGYNKDTWVESKCIRSYDRCAVSNSDGCAGGDSWTSSSGDSFDYLETRVFYLDDGTMPNYLYVEDDTNNQNCARALYKDQVQDFGLGPGNSLNLLDDLDIDYDIHGATDPVQLTIVPFGGDASCTPVGDIEVERSIAVWLSVNEGQSSNPNDGTIYCDVSVNPEDCLNLPYWESNPPTHKWGMELKLYGTLSDVLSSNPDKVHIYIPEGYDMTLPINNLSLRFLVTSGYEDGCYKFVNGDTATCKVDKVWESYENPSYETYQTKIEIDGLGRINGFGTFAQQYNNNLWHDEYDYLYDESPSSIDLVGSGWNEYAYWRIMASLVNLYCTPSLGKDEFALDVSGIEVGWGSKFGVAIVALNTGDNNEYPAKLFDFKYLSWNDQADGPEMYGRGSYSAYTYTQSGDDNIKVGAIDSVRLEATLLQGSGGCAINLGAFGASAINNSRIDKVYVHRMLHSKDLAWNGCAVQDLDGNGQGGVICTRSCAMKEDGLIDTTVSNLFIPDLGGANSVARPFAIGVNTESVFCKGNNHVKGSYPIRNLVFKNINIQPNPGCSSVLYDNTGQVVWGDNGSGTPSMAFYNAEESDQANCDFHEVVQFSANPAYYVCGETDEVDAAKHCMTEDGVGSEPNIDYSSVLDGTNVNVDFPYCDLGSWVDKVKKEVALA